MRLDALLWGEKMRLLVKFQKTGPARYISHLDLLRCVQRTLRRSGAPLRYSMGYNPHPLLIFAQALPLYMESIGEYFSIELTEPVDCEKFLMEFNRSGFLGITALQARMMSPEEKSLMATAAAARYSYVWNAEKLGDFTEFLAQKEILVEREKKGKTAILDIRPWVYSIEVGTDQRLRFIVGCGEGHHVPAHLFVQAVLSFVQGEDKTIMPADILREELYYQQNDELIPFDQILPI